MRDTTRLMLALLGLQITLFGVMMALVASAGLQYWSVETGFMVAGAGFLVSVPSLLTAGSRSPM